MYEYRAAVVRVVDGDTVDLDVDLGFHVGVRIRTRLLGINAPELRDKPAGPDARAFLARLLPVGETVRVETRKDAGDKYGRWLATIWLPTYDVSVNDTMVAQGHAAPAPASWG